MLFQTYINLFLWLNKYKRRNLLVTKQLLVAIVFFPYYGSQWLPECFRWLLLYSTEDRKIETHTGRDLNEWCQKFHFSVNHPFKGRGLENWRHGHRNCLPQALLCHLVIFWTSRSIGDLEKPRLGPMISERISQPNMIRWCPADQLLRLLRAT